MWSKLSEWLQCQCVIKSWLGQLWRRYERPPRGQRRSSPGCVCVCVIQPSASSLKLSLDRIQAGRKRQSANHTTQTGPPPNSSPYNRQSFGSQQSRWFSAFHAWRIWERTRAEAGSLGLHAAESAVEQLLYIVTEGCMMGCGGGNVHWVQFNHVKEWEGWNTVCL